MACGNPKIPQIDVSWAKKPSPCPYCCPSKNLKMLFLLQITWEKVGFCTLSLSAIFSGQNFFKVCFSKKVGE